MLVRLRGWGDTDVLALLAVLRKNLLLYVYATDREFAEAVRGELPDKMTHEILEMVRALMLQFGLGLSTKNFRTDVIVTNGQEVYVYEHIYESISQLSENKAGGVWLPDELRRFLQKAKQYRELFASNQDVYFKRVQLWGKSVAETKSKFYALREIFVRERRRSRQRTGVNATRLELLREIFAKVPPARRAEKVEVPSSGKAPKLWSAEQMTALIDFLVRITTEIQRTGSSDLVNQAAEALHRTDGSLVNKLAAMREKFLKKSTSATLPDTVYDPTSEAYKIFCADWSDNNDPYALGYLALKSRSLRLTAERSKRRRSKNIWGSRPKLRSATIAARGASTPSVNQTEMPARSNATPSASAKHVERVQNSTHAPHSSSSRSSGGSVSRPPASRVQADAYVAFVRGIAEQCQWTEKVVHNVLRCMQHSIDLYRSNNLLEFFDKIASLTPDLTFQDIFAEGQHILIQFEQRFGTLDSFENVMLTASNINLPMATPEQETKEQDRVTDNAADAVGATSADVHDNVTANDADTQNNPEVENPDGGEREHHESSMLGPQTEGSQTRAEDAVLDACERDQPPVPGSPAQTIEVGSEDAGVDGVESEQEQSQGAESPVPTPHTGSGDAADEHISSPAGKQSRRTAPIGSPGRTPQTSNEDAVDEHNSSTAGKQSSPEDAWDADDDMEDDALDTQSVASSENAWSGDSNACDARDSQHSKSNSPPSSPYPPFNNSKKPFKRGKDEQYGKNYATAKKRRLDEKSKPSEIKDDEDDDEDEGYDEGDESEDADEEPLVDDEAMSSEEVLEETPHPLQSILTSLDSHVAELQEKQRKLIERKEDREWHQRHYADHEYGFQLSMHAFASER